jgi:hypothetical protein
VRIPTLRLVSLFAVPFAGYAPRTFSPATAPPAHPGLDAESFRVLAECWARFGPSRRWEMCHDGLQHRADIEGFYSALPPESDAVRVEVGRLRLLDGDTAPIIEVTAHAGPLTRTAWLHVAKRDGAWLVDLPKTAALAED